MSLVFIAIPTSGTVRGGKISEKFLKKLAGLHKAYPDRSFWAPMVQDYALLPYMENVEATWEVWGAHCRRMIEACDEVWVLKYPGWQESVGVQAEIEHALALGKRIAYVVIREEDYV